jgi:hypothetical protein
MPVIAPQLQTNPRDFVQAAERGRALGQAASAQRDRVAMQSGNLAQAAQQLAQREKLALMETAAAKEQQEREFLTTQHRTDVQDAHNRAQLSLEKQKLDQTAQESAKDFAAQQELSRLVQSGVPMEQAILRVPRLMNRGVNTSLVNAATRRPATMGRMSDIDRMKYTTAQKNVADMEKSGQNRLSTGFLGMGSGKENPKYASAKQAMAEIEARYTENGAPAAAPPASAGAVTHIWNPKTGKIEAVKAAPESEAIEISPSGVPMLKTAGNTYGGMLPNEHFEQVKK